MTVTGTQLPEVKQRTENQMADITLPGTFIGQTYGKLKAFPEASKRWNYSSSTIASFDAGNIGAAAAVSKLLADLNNEKGFRSSVAERGAQSQLDEVDLKVQQLQASYDLAQSDLQARLEASAAFKAFHEPMKLALQSTFGAGRGDGRVKAVKVKSPRDFEDVAAELAAIDAAIQRISNAHPPLDVALARITARLDEIAEGPSVINITRFAGVRDDTTRDEFNVQLPRMPGADWGATHLMGRNLNPLAVDNLALNLWANREAIFAKITAELTEKYAGLDTVSDDAKAEQLAKLQAARKALENEAAAALWAGIFAGDGLPHDRPVLSGLALLGLEVVA